MVHTRAGRLTTWLAALGLVIALARAASAQPAAPIPINIGAASNVLFAPVFVLADSSNGIARKHGLQVDARIFASGIATMEAALAGDIDVAFPNTRVLLPLLASDKACFRAGITFVDVNTVQMVAMDSIKTPQDLVGKKVGTVAGAVGDVALHMWLLQKGIDPNKVKFVNVAEPDLPIALAQGSVDAIIWTEPTPSIAMQILGSKAHYFGDIGAAYRDVSPVNVTCKWVEKNGDKGMEALTAAWIDAVQYIKTHPEQAEALTAKNLQITQADVARIWKNGGWPAGWPADLADDQFDMYNVYGKYLISIGDLKTMPDLSKWISSKWLRAVAPDRVHLTKYHY